MTKLKTFATLILTVILIAFICTGATVVPAPADEFSIHNKTAAEEVLSSTDTEDPSISIDGIAESFNEYLKGKYGEEYALYYNRIIEQWGSIEAYLLAFGNKLPEERQNSWQKFVGWLSDYAPVWAVPLALVIVIVLAVVARKQFKKIIEKVVDERIAPIIKELNSQSKASVSMIHSQKKLLGNNAKFSETVAELETAEKELKNE